MQVLLYKTINYNYVFFLTFNIVLYNKLINLTNNDDTLLFDHSSIVVNVSYIR